MAGSWSAVLVVCVLLCTPGARRAFVVPGHPRFSGRGHAFLPLSASTTATTSTTTVVLQDLLRVNTSSSTPVYAEFEGADELTVAVVVAADKGKDKGSSDADGPGGGGGGASSSSGKDSRREPRASVAPAAVKKFFLPKALDGASPEEVWAWWQARRTHEARLKHAIASKEGDIRPYFAAYAPYVAADRADVLQAHADFYRAIAEGDMDLMRAVWLHPRDANVNLNTFANSADVPGPGPGPAGSAREWEVLCFQAEKEGSGSGAGSGSGSGSGAGAAAGPGGAAVAGYEAVMALWAAALAVPSPHLQVRDVQLTYQGDVAVVTSTVSGWAEHRLKAPAASSSSDRKGKKAPHGGASVLVTDVFVRPHGSDRFNLVAHVSSACPASEEAAVAAAGSGSGSGSAGAAARKRKAAMQVRPNPFILICLLARL